MLAQVGSYFEALQSHLRGAYSACTYTTEAALNRRPHHSKLAGAGSAPGVAAGHQSPWFPRLPPRRLDRHQEDGAALLLQRTVHNGSRLRGGTNPEGQISTTCAHEPQCGAADQDQDRRALDAGALERTLQTL